ncbi:hypothetical protein Y032_0004g1995 [Ancylostoma ceylanicum]|uniref:Uncharacterized protein n=1 Tax=Ancylostoma ceylanicum TaxID=53326 RepID=A0A016VV29_9BILA|nr:hypothetical protein Y032_0004g1995 [Ancylostoma ceylanicum]
MFRIFSLRSLSSFDSCFAETKEGSTTNHGTNSDTMLVHLFLLFFLAGAATSSIPAEYFRFRRLDFPDFTRDEVMI